MKQVAICMVFFGAQSALSADLCRTYSEGRYCSYAFIRLIVDSDEFYGKHVELQGFLWKERGEFVIYRNREDASYGFAAESLSILSRDSEMMELLDKYAGLQVRLRGVLRKNLRSYEFRVPRVAVIEIGSSPSPAPKNVELDSVP